MSPLGPLEERHKVALGGGLNQRMMSYE
jgi:hypothetical protein